MARTKQVSGDAAKKVSSSKKGGKPVIQSSKHGKGAKTGKDSKVPRKQVEMLKKPRRSDQDAIKKERKKRRNRPGTVAKREVKTFRYGKRSNELLLQKAPFQNLVREISQNLNPDMRIQAKFFEMLQTGSEIWMVNVAEGTRDLMQLANRLSVNDRLLRVSAKSYFKGGRLPPQVRKEEKIFSAKGGKGKKSSAKK